MNAVHLLKNELRKKVQSERMELPVDEWLEKSDQICEHLLQSEFYSKAGFIHCYISMDERKEVNTHHFIERALQDSKQVAVPVTDFEKQSLSHVQIERDSAMKKNKWGVSEPVEKREADISALDLIVIPMAAADKKGNRLGYGKGFYDRFLIHTSAVKVGLIFQDFIFDEIPAEKFDIKMDIIISEKGIISCNNAA